MPRSAPIHRPRQVKAPKHNAQGKAARNRQQRRAMHTGSKAWRAIREMVLIRDNWTCKDCGRYGDQVDHIDGDNANNPPDGSNWQTLCHVHHSAKTMRELNASLGR